jgi:putative spermidine/putrescine transport system permease protein
VSPRTKRAAVLLVLPVAFMIAFFLAPVGILLGSSAHGLPSTDPAATPVWFGPYRQFFTGTFYIGTLGLTMRIAAIVTVISVIVGYPVAYYINAAGQREKVYLTLLVLSPLMISLVVRSFGWVVLLSRNGAVNSLLKLLGLTDHPLRLMYTEWTAIAGLTHVFVPFMILSIMVTLQDIDPILLRAATSLGAPPARSFLTVILPLSIPGILAGSVIVFTLTASSFVTPAILGGSRLKLAASLAYDQALFTLNWPFAAAISAILLGVCLLVLGLYSFVIRQRVFEGVFSRNATLD